MPSSAITAQNAALKVATAQASTLTITGATKANPCVVTAANTFVGGEIVQIDAVGGMIEVNGRAFVVASPVAGSFALKGVDSTGYTTFTTGGTVTAQTMTTIGNVKTFNLTPDSPTEIDVTNLASTRKEFRVGLAGSWKMTADYDVDTADIGQAELAKASGAGTSRVLTIVLTNGKVFAGVGYVLSATADGSPDAVVKGQISFRGTGQPTWFA